MPELPEVETTRLGLERHLINARIGRLVVRERRLRWPIAAGLEEQLAGRRIAALERRGKYLLIALDSGWLLVHLGMSGSLRWLPHPSAASKHDHYDLELEGGGVVRYNDPRRFGCLQFTQSPGAHPLLSLLGPEPLGAEFTGGHLFALSRGRKVAVKPFIMTGAVVVGVGNIYANEALYRAGIHPGRAAGRIALKRYEALCAAIRDVLRDALEAGGTTLRDFVGGDGRPGYFRQSLAVYERDNEPCRRCGTSIRRVIIGQRASYFCPRCQR